MTGENTTSGPGPVSDESTPASAWDHSERDKAVLRTILDRLGAQLRGVYAGFPDEPAPRHLLDLLDRLNGEAPGLLRTPGVHDA